MKKYIYTALFTLVIGSVQAQLMRISVRAGGLPNSSVVTIRPSANFSGKLGEMGFTVMVPKESPPGTPIPAPTINVKTTCATCLNSTFPPANWVQTSDFTSDPNFYLFKLGCVNPNIATSPTLNISNGVDQDAVAIEFINSTLSPTQIRIAHLADGGPGTAYGVAIYDGTSNDLTNYVQMFVGPGAVPGSPLPDESTGYSTLQYITLSSVVLPSRFGSFIASKINTNGMLNWNMENQDANMSHFEIERSFDGASFSRIGRTEINANLSQTGYEYNDVNVFESYKGKAYYRIKLVNRNGEVLYSAIRILKPESKAFALNIYPNPVVKEANIAFTLESAQPVTILLTDANGKRITDFSMQAQKGINQKQIDVSSLAAGTYMFLVRTADESQTIPFVKSN
jgi:hypothetical protein